MNRDVPERHDQVELPAVGHPDVDDALASLADIDLASPQERVARYGEIHDSLQQVLRTIDAA